MTTVTPMRGQAPIQELVQTPVLHPVRSPLSVDLCGNRRGWAIRAFASLEAQQLLRSWQTTPNQRARALDLRAPVSALATHEQMARCSRPRLRCGSASASCSITCCGFVVLRVLIAIVVPCQRPAYTTPDPPLPTSWRTVSSCCGVVRASNSRLDSGSLFALGGASANSA